MLLLYMSSNHNMGLFDKPCQENSIILKQLNGEFNLNQFITQDVSNLNCYQYLSIDLSCLKDNDDDIINSIVGIKSMYDIRVIILAIGYENNNSLLGRLFAEGIYNIITATKISNQQTEILNCITSDGMQYKDALKFRMQDNEKTNQTRVVIQKQSINQTVSVGVCGALHRIGTTTQALHIAKYLSNNGYKACYIEDNGHGHMDTLSDYYNIKTSDTNFITYDDVDIFLDSDMRQVFCNHYDFLVYDYGLFEETDIQQYLSKDIKIICVGSNSWEAPCIIPAFKNIGEYNDTHFIFSFTSESMQKDIKKLMGKFKDKSYFSKYTPELIDGSTNREMYKEVLRDYVQQEGEKIPLSKNVFRRFKLKK